MNSRERIWAAFDHQELDHVPAWPGKSPFCHETIGLLGQAVLALVIDLGVPLPTTGSYRLAELRVSRSGRDWLKHKRERCD